MFYTITNIKTKQNRNLTNKNHAFKNMHSGITKHLQNMIPFYNTPICTEYTQVHIYVILGHNNIYALTIYLAIVFIIIMLRHHYNKRHALSYLSHIDFI